MEVWKDIPDWEGFYQASSNGRVRSLARRVQKKNGVWMSVKAKILKRKITGNCAYAHLCDTSRDRDEQHSVACCVLIAFEGIPAPGFVAAHKNKFDTLNDALENLQWADRLDWYSANAIAFDAVSSANEGNQKRAKNLVERVLEIKKANPTLMQQQIADLLNVHLSTVGKAFQMCPEFKFVSSRKVLKKQRALAYAQALEG